MSITNQGHSLLVDTDPLYLERFAQGLPARHFNVVVTGSGEQAFRSLSDWRPRQPALLRCQSAGPD